MLYPFVPHFTRLPNLSLDWFTFLNPVFHIPLAAPDPTHVLPILAALATFIQLRMSQTRTQATSSSASDPTAQSMKMMQFVMPIITLFIGWTFPAGLALYWTVSSIFQVVQQYFVTGWGALAVVPNLNLAGITGSGSSGSTNSNGTSKAMKNGNTVVDAPKARTLVRADSNTEDDVDSDAAQADGTTNRQARSTSRNSTSASARRRSSNVRRRRTTSR
jgi:YidC/Oxa1 family membrane protein insertase